MGRSTRAWLALAALVANGSCSRVGDVGPQEDAPAPPVAAGEEELELLSALGYAEWLAGEGLGDAPGGVVRFEAGQRAGGLNLYKSDPRHRAHLLTMDGRIAHTWHAPDDAARSWHHIELNAAGELFGVVKTSWVEKLDWRSKRLWRLELSAHHDLALAPSGVILALTERVREIEIHGTPCPIIDHGIATISAHGELLDELLLSTLFAERIAPGRVAEIREYLDVQGGRVHRKAELLDVFHANSIELLERDVPHLGAAGQVLVSLRNLDLIAVIGLDPARVVWSFGEGVLDRQHQPSVLANGNVLVFDNGTRRGWSRVLEIAPASGEIVWEYRADPPESFFSHNRGGAEQLDNGNILIVDSDTARAFEITRAGEIVWEFRNPDVDPKKGRRAAIYRMHRVPPGVAERLPR